MKVTFKDKSQRDFPEANDWASKDYPDGCIALVKRTFDEDGDYDRDDDEEIAVINSEEFLCIER
jgi:hypothetical protein